MLFRKKREESVESAWQAFARRLELEDASAVAERLRRWLDLEDVMLDPVYALQRDGQPTLYLFEYLRRRSGPTGSVGQRVANCLLRAEEPFASIGLRAHPKRNSVMESLEASRTGSSIVDLPAGCGSAISVFARDPDEAARVMTTEACQVLERALGRHGADAVVIGERYLLATLETDDEGADATRDDTLAARHDALEALAADVFALYAALKRQSSD